MKFFENIAIHAASHCYRIFDNIANNVSIVLVIYFYKINLYENL